MRRSGLIYSASLRQKSGEVFIALSWATRLLYGFLRGIGSGLAATAVLVLVVIFGPAISAELQFRFSKTPTQTSAFGAILDQIRAEEEKHQYIFEKAQELGAPDTYFSVVIPRISAKAKILANVDAADPTAYASALQEGVAHAKGSVFPGMPGGTFLFAHSTDAPWNITRYNAVFYLLKDLEVGDEIYVFFLDELYKYKVSQKQITEPQDVSWLTGAREGSQRLILQTCWPPGTTLKRLIVVAEPV